MSQLCNEHNYKDGIFLVDSIQAIYNGKQNNTGYELEKWMDGNTLSGVSIKVDGLQGYDFRRYRLNIDEMRSLANDLLKTADELENVK